MSADNATTMTPEQQSAAEWDCIAPAYGAALRDPIAQHACFVVEAVAREAAAREADAAVASTGAEPQRWPCTILDVGCGPGDLALALKRRFPWARVLGCDISKAMVEQAQSNIVAAAINVEVFQAAWPPAAASAAATAIPAVVDVIVTSFVMQYVHDPPGFTAALRERVSPNGGRVFVSVWSHASENPWLSVGKALFTLKMRDQPLPASASSLVNDGAAAGGGGGGGGGGDGGGGDNAGEERVVADLVAVLDEHSGPFSLAGGGLGDALRGAGLGVRSEATVSYRMALNSGGPDQLLRFFKGMGDERDTLLRMLCTRWIQQGGVPAAFVLATAERSSSSSTGSSEAATSGGCAAGGAGGEQAGQEGEKPQDNNAEALVADDVEEHDAKKARKSAADDDE